MEKIRFILFFVLIFSVNLHAQVPEIVTYRGEPLCLDSKWKIIFQDDFSGQELDTSKWFTYFPYAPGNMDTCRFCRTHSTTSYNQIYVDRNVHVADGLLHLQVKNEAATWKGFESQYTAGMVYSKQVFTNYARYEIRCKIPHDPHITAAFWAFGWSTEIDVFELSGKRYTQLMMTVHKWGNNGKSHYQSSFLKNYQFWNDFHVYTAIYDPNFVRFYVDYNLVDTKSRYETKRGRTIDKCALKPGKEYSINPIYPRPGDPLQVIANTAVDPFREHTVPVSGEAVLLKDFLIDYIRVYQRTNE